MSAIQLIVGLGNPGEEYKNTRHNAGAWFVEYFAAQNNITLELEKKFHGRKGEHEVYIKPIDVERSPTITFPTKYWILIPSTYMNESGKAVAAMASFYKIPPESILVAHDELDFPVGKIRLKESGGHGGHNGLRSIIDCLGSDQFVRLRIGIDHPGHRDQVVPYVLNKPSKSDREKIDAAIADCVRPVEYLISGERQKAFRELHN